MTKPLDLSKPPFQTDEDPPRKAELLRAGVNHSGGYADIWLITCQDGDQYPVARKADGTSDNRYSIVNAPRRIPFWILPNRQGNIERVSTLKPVSCSGWRGPFYMDEDGNPVSGDE